LFQRLLFPPSRRLRLTRRGAVQTRAGLSITGLIDETQKRNAEAGVSGAFRAAAGV